MAAEDDVEVGFVVAGEGGETGARDVGEGMEVEAVKDEVEEGEEEKGEEGGEGEE